MIKEISGTGIPRSGVHWATNSSPLEDYNGQLSLMIPYCGRLLFRLQRVIQFRSFVVQMAECVFLWTFSVIWKMTVVTEVMNRIVVSVKTVATDTSANGWFSEIVFFVDLVDKSTCAPNQFRCVQSGRCMHSRYRCDKSPDCTDGSDEAGCNTTGTSSFKRLEKWQLC